MPTVLTPDASVDSRPLADLLAAHGVNDPGRVLFRQVRQSRPVRAVSGRAGNVTGRYPSRKMGFAVQYESRTVEFAFLILCEVDPDVVAYYDQPCVLSLDYPSRKGRRLVVNHTPDFLVLGAEFAGFVECKPEDKLPKLAADAPSRYVADGEGGWRCPPGEAAAARYGLGYRVWTPAGVSPALIDNARFLEAEWGRSTQSFADADVERVVDAVVGVPGIQLEELVHRIDDAALVYWCIYHRRVHVDLVAHFLSQPDRVRVFADAPAAAAWSAAIASVADTQESAADTLSRAALAKYPPDVLSVALERYAVIRHAIETGAPQSVFTGPRAYSHRRWLAAYRQAQREGGVGLVGLCPKDHLRGNYKPRLLPESYEVIEQVVAEEYENKRNVTAKVAHGYALARCADQGLPCLSYAGFLSYLKRRDQARSVARRKGAKAAAAAAPAFGPADPAVRGQGPFDVVHIDHTLLDVFVRVGPEHDAPTDRLWLTVAICAWSRCILGYDLSFDAPAVGGLLTTMRDLFDRHKRAPNRIVVDHGPEFGSTAFDALCRACSIDNRQRPPGRPKFGAPVERLFSTANTQLVHVLSGNTQLLKNPRAMSRDVDPRPDALWRLTQLDAVVRRFLFEVYPRQPHKGLDGMTPHSRFEHGLATVGSGRPLTDSSDIRFLLWPPSRRDTATVDSRTGIVVDCIHYWHPDMRSETLRRKKVRVRVDPYDVGHVVAFIGKRWVLCRAECAADLAGRSRRELRLASQELRQRRREGAKRQAVRAPQLAAMLRELAETEEGLRQELRDEERRAVLENRGLHLVTDSSSAGEHRSGSGESEPAPLDFDDIGSGTRL